jgi:hypothetical protein
MSGMLLFNKPQNLTPLAICALLAASVTPQVFAAPAEPSAESSAAGGKSAKPLFLTMTNGTGSNYLVVIDTNTKETSYLPTNGFGGASGNAGGVAVAGTLAAVVNFGSQNVTIFVRHGNNLQPTQMIPTASKPLSVAFAHSHLFVLGQTTLQSFAVYGESVQVAADGSTPLLHSDGSAAQVVGINGGVAYSEKSGTISIAAVSASGTPGLTGAQQAVTLPPAPNNDTPFGMAGRGANLYATIAHSDENVLIVNAKIVSNATGPVPFKNASGAIIHAPCWNTLSGQYMYSSDSPGQQVLRYLVSDTNVFYDTPVGPRLAGAPTDLFASDDLLAVIDGGDGATSNASLMTIDDQGELTMKFSLKIAGPINGAAIIN